VTAFAFDHEQIIKSEIDFEYVDMIEGTKASFSDKFVETNDLSAFVLNADDDLKQRLYSVQRKLREGKLDYIVMDESAADYVLKDSKGFIKLVTIVEFKFKSPVELEGYSTYFVFEDEIFDYEVEDVVQDEFVDEEILMMDVEKYQDVPEVVEEEELKELLLAIDEEEKTVVETLDLAIYPIIIGVVVMIIALLVYFLFGPDRKLSVNIKKEIDYLKKYHYTKDQIKNYLLKRGYKAEDIDKVLRNE